MKKTARMAAGGRCGMPLPSPLAVSAATRTTRPQSPSDDRRRAARRPPRATPTSRRAWCPTRAASTTSRSTRPRTTGLTDAEEQFGVQTGEVESNVRRGVRRQHQGDGQGGLQRRSPRSASCSVTPPRPPPRRTRRRLLDRRLRLREGPRRTSRASPSTPPSRPTSRATWPRRESETGIVGTFGGLQHPDRDHLHGGLPPGRREVQRGQRRRRQAPRLGRQGRLVHRGLRGQDQGPVDRRADDPAGRGHHLPGRRSRRPRWPPGRQGRRRPRRSGSTPTAASRPPSTATSC